MRLFCIGIALACAGLVFADTVTMKNGRVIQGTYLGGTARQIRVDRGDQIQTLDVSDVSRIEFSGSDSASQPAPNRSEIYRVRAPHHPFGRRIEPKPRRWALIPETLRTSFSKHLEQRRVTPREVTHGPIQPAGI